MSMPNPVITMRLDPALVAWLDAYAEAAAVSRTEIVAGVLQALREGRVVVVPLDPFPGTTPDHFPGTTPDNPLRVAR